MSEQQQVMTYSSTGQMAPVIGGKGDYIKVEDFMKLQMAFMQMQQMYGQAMANVQMFKHMWAKAGNEGYFHVEVSDDATEDDLKALNESGVTSTGWYFVAPDGEVAQGPYVTLEDAKASEKK